MNDNRLGAQTTTNMRSFLVIWIGQAFSLLGSQLVQFALVWWLTRTTRSASMLALATLAALLPQILLAPFAGALVDRWNRRAILIVADSLVALATLVMAALFWLDIAAVWTIYLLLVVRAAGAAFHWPTMQASTTLMVPEKHLGRIGGLNQTLGGLANIVIPPLGALAVETLTMQAVLAIDVATAIPAVACLFFVAIPQPQRVMGSAAVQGKPSLWADMRQGLQFILNWKGLLFFSLIGIMINLLGPAAGSLIPIVVVKHFSGGALELGWLQSAVGVGAVLGGIVLGVWGGTRRRVIPSMLALFLDGLAILFFGLSPASAFAFAVVMLFCMGFLEAIVIGLNGAIGQAIIPPEVQGRVFALLFSVAQVFAPLGLLIAGPIADAFGIQIWYVLTGVIIAVMGAGALFIPSILHIEEPAYQPHPPAPVKM